jgi:hypothetical protein
LNKSVIEAATPLICVACLTALEITAILTGNNGTYFAIVIAAVAAIGGFKANALIASLKAKSEPPATKKNTP